MASAVNENRAVALILAILLPPLAVFLSEGVSGSFWLNLVLTIVGFWIIGVIHALMVVL